MFFRGCVWTSILLLGKYGFIKLTFTILAVATFLASMHFISAQRWLGFAFSSYCCRCNFIETFVGNMPP